MRYALLEYRIMWELRHHLFVWLLPVAYAAAMLASKEVRGAREYYVFFAHYVAEMGDCV